MFPVKIASTVALAAFALVSPFGSVTASPVRPLENTQFNLDGQLHQNFRGDAVKDAFRHSWNGYKQYAWGYDELLSVSKRGGNSRNGWGASIADALSTAILMNLDDVVLEILPFLEDVNFKATRVPGSVSLFETTIRYLGGLLSGYDLLNGPYSTHYKSLPGVTSQVESLLEQAVVLADRLSFAFNTPSGIPYNNLEFPTNSSFDSVNGVATIGTLILEWTRLSDITGNPKYANLASKAESYLLNPKPVEVGEPFPGMLGTRLDIRSGLFLDSEGGWSGGTDSFYEYLLKMWIYSPSENHLYRDRWLAAAESTQKYLISKPRGKPNTTFVAEYRDKSTLSLNQGHLTCFIGGNFILGGQLLDRPDIKKTGLALTDGCHDSYIRTATRIGPERWSWDSSAVPQGQQDFFAKNGFFITTSYYDLRPETIESYYHGWRLTGNPKYQEWAWDAFLNINSTCRTDAGFSGVRNVNVVGGGEKMDYQESFWFAEVLKYLYLTFTSETEVGVKRGPNKWVFNTEAHPLKVKDYDAY